VARRSGEEWFVGAITNNDARTVEVPLTFLEPGIKYMASIYYDDEKLNSRTNVNIKVQKTDSSKKLAFDLKAGGGVAIRIQPQ
jgi:alpha-glucosidase